MAGTAPTEGLTSSSPVSRSCRSALDCVRRSATRRAGRGAGRPRSSSCTARGWSGSSPAASTPGARRGRLAAALGDDAARGEPDADPRPATPSRSRSGSGGARQRPAVHGVARRQRRAARRSTTGSPGSAWRAAATDCSASASTLELAIKQALERGGARPRRASRSRACSRRAPMAATAGRTHDRLPGRGTAPRRGSTSTGSTLAAAGLVARRRRPELRSSSQTSTARCWPTATAAPGAAARCTPASSRTVCFAAPRASGRSSCPARAARWTTTGCSSSRCRCCARTATVRVALAT